MKSTLKQLKKQLEKEIGKPCKKKNPLCYNCIAWNALEILEEIAEIPKFSYTKKIRK